MKTILQSKMFFLLLLFTFLFATTPIQLLAQPTIELYTSNADGSPCDINPTHFQQNGTQNGKYYYQALFGPPLEIIWSGERWEINVNDGGLYHLWISHAPTSMNPPCGGSETWFFVGQNPEFCGTVDRLIGECETPIPTIGEWGLIILGLSLITLGTVVVYQRRVSIA